VGARRRLVCLLLGIGALAVLAGCSGHTTGASRITEHADGSYSAKLNAVGSCDEGSSSAPCEGYMRWRAIGTEAWTEGPSRTVDHKISNRPGSQTARGLAPKTKYEYQVCGKEFSDEQVICVGPDGTPETTDEFVTVASSGAALEATDQGGKNRSAAKAGEPTAPAAGTTASGSEPNSATSASGASPSGGDGGTSPLVPIVIAVGAVGLLVGGVWWARMEPVPISTPPPTA
jgi:hypothetical protein